MSFLQQVIDSKDKIFAPTAQKRLAQILDEQAKGEARKNIELMAGNSMLAEVARHAYEEFVKQYGRDEALEQKLGVDDATNNSPDVGMRHASSSSSTTKHDPLQDAIERARNFEGKKNSDWTPYIHTFEVNGLQLDMCLVPRGRFMMGDNDISKRERPVHEQVIDKPFWIGRHPITNGQWRQAVNASNGAVTVPEFSDWHPDSYEDKTKINHPVVGVTWHQCNAFAKWLGENWKLPTEVQWEYSARGLDNLIYPFGNDFQPDLVVYRGNSGKTTAEIGGRAKGASWVGAQDMAGNVWEWIASVYKPYPYQVNDRREDMSVDGLRVLRGGSWSGNINNARSSSRDYNFSHSRINFSGFRICSSPFSLTEH